MQRGILGGEIGGEYRGCRRHLRSDGLFPHFGAADMVGNHSLKMGDKRDPLRLAVGVLLR